MPKSNPYTMHVISHTHWDREWTQTLQQFRVWLVDMVDNAINVLTRNPDYKHFHLDSQTVLLEDYFEIRPENRAKIRKLTKAGRLIVGPWYSLPDLAPISGESIVRNLLIGTAITRDLEGKHLSGYSPFGFGQIAQTPQIYRGFGIDNCFFYRGNNRHQTRSEFIWEAPDGSRILGFRAAERFGRGNYWVNVFRPAVHNKWPMQWAYHWEEGQMPFHPAEPDAYFRYDYNLVEPTDLGTYHPENLPKALETARNELRRDAVTHHLACFDGNDATEPHPAMPRIIRDSNKVLAGAGNPSGGERYVHDTFANFAKAVWKESSKLEVKKGEFRYTNVDGLWLNLYYGTLASRIYLKQNNRRAEHGLHSVCEPLCSAAWLLGHEYPRQFLEVAWKYLLQNQAHDSIAGCSVNRVHLDNEYRSRQVDEITGAISAQAFGRLAAAIDGSALPDDALLVVAFNTLPHPRREVVTAAIDIPVEASAQSIQLFDHQGGEVPVQVIRQEGAGYLVHAPREFPLSFSATRFLVRFDTGTIPGLGYKTFLVRHAPGSAPGTPKPGSESSRGRGKDTPGRNLVTTPRSMANEHLSLEFADDGTMTLTDKETGKSFRGLHYFEDGSDVGDPWGRKTAKAERVISSKGATAQIQCIEEGPLAATFRIDVTMEIPKDAPADGSRRSDELVPLHLSTTVTMVAGSRRVEFETRFDNPARDHRLRVLFPSDIATDVSWAEAQFDVISRPIKLPDCSTWKEPAPAAHPQLNFVDVNDGKLGLAVLNAGLPEYEVVDEPRRPIAITLLRTHRFPLCGADPDVRIEHPFEQGGQLIGPHACRYALYPHAGDWNAAQVQSEAHAFNVPVKLAQCGKPKGKLPLSAAFFTFSPAQVMLSCVKKAHQRESLILRLYNPTNQAITATIASLVPIKQAYVAELSEKRIKALRPARGKISVPIPRKKIVTLDLVMKRK